ncbi:cell surface protein [Pontiella sulfatireligans]|uniref:Antigen Lp49 n=1 Tax=Pontiella sulfatireligans TaxID=2750658 RepID=A0A6C2UKD8_9BACT|nr:cell surface protein [Pontiella sulfatireligans]VGO19656.1 Antigen Lp49 [Pontiella sulfatireligans]
MNLTKCIFFLLCAVCGAGASPYLSPVDLDWEGDGRHLLVTAASGRKVLVLDAEALKVVRSIEFPVELAGSAVSPDGRTLYAVGGVAEGRVFAVDLASGKILTTMAVGHTPMAPVLSPDGGTLYVCNRFDNDISVLDLKTGAEMARIPVTREPVAADISHDGLHLFVANHIPSGRADVDYVASEISVIDTQTRTVAIIPLVNGAEGVRGLRVSPDGKYAFATHFMARFQVPTTQLERGWVSTDALSVIRVSDQALMYTVLLDDLSRGFPNPWAIGFSDDGTTLVVSAASSHEISLIDLPKLMQKVESEAVVHAGAVHLDAHNNLSFLSGIRKRIELNGNGPRALAVKGTTAYVAHYFSDSIDIVDFTDQNSTSIETLELNPGMKITQRRQGEIFFHDANLCFQKWLSCSTCHPDARTDAMNWDLLNDGMGNPKNVKSMLLAHETPRAMWLGVRDGAEAGVRAGIRHIQFAVRPEEDAEAIDAYLKSLQPVPSPYLVDGRLSPSASNGKELFEEQGCASCHPAPLFTSLEMHDVGTMLGQDAGKPVDVPSLVELWRTAPYLHDGRAATVGDLLHGEDHAGIIKRTADLTEQQLLDLEAYLLSL